MRGITLFSLLHLAIKHMFILILSAVVFASAAFAYCEFVATPSYSAKGSILVTNGAVDKDVDIDENGEATKLENTDIVASINFLSTAKDMLLQNKIYKQLANKLDNRYSFSQLHSMVKIEKRTENSLYIDISFKASTKEEALKITNEFLELTPSYIKEEVKGVAVSIYVADTASQVYPKKSVAVVIAAFLGIAVTFAILVIIFLMNTTITNEEEFSDRFDIPVIGSIPDFSSAKSNSYYKKYNKYYSYYGYSGKGNRKNDN